MNARTRIVVTIAICAIIVSLAVGTGFSYSAVTVNSGNSASSVYLVVSPGDSKYSGNFDHYFEYHWGTTVTKSEDPVSRIYSPCGWYIKSITVDEETIQAYILGDMKLEIMATNDLDDYTIHMDIPRERYYLISDSYDYVVTATVLSDWPSEDENATPPAVYGETSTKYFSDYEYDEEGHLISKSYEADFVISTTSGVGKDIVLDDLPVDYDKKEYKVVLTLYLVAKTLTFQPEFILGEDTERHVGIDFEFTVTAND